MNLQSTRGDHLDASLWSSSDRLDGSSQWLPGYELAAVTLPKARGPIAISWRLPGRNGFESLLSLMYIISLF